MPDELLCQIVDQEGKIDPALTWIPDGSLRWDGSGIDARYPIGNLLGMMPKVGMLKELKDVKVDEKEINHVVAIIDSMTPHERENHMIINGSRRRRIAKGSGTSVQEVNQLLKQYSQARKMMKSFSGGLMGKKLGKLKLPPGFPFGGGDMPGM